MPSVDLLQDVSSGVALAGTSPLPARSHASARQSSGLPDPATAADPHVADSPRELDESFPIARVPAPATACSCTLTPRSELPLATGSSCAVHPGDPSWLSVLASLGSQPHPAPTARYTVPPRVARTSAHAHWLPCPRAPVFPELRGRDKTFPLPRSVPSEALRNLPFRYPQTQFVGSPGDNRIL